MGKYSKRAMVTLLPEWGPVLDKLKQDRFYTRTQADMFRYLIGLGMEALKTESEGDKKQRKQSV